jgi:hypothetical protein
MPRSLKHFFQQLPPFILLGVSIAFAVGLFIVFSYVLLWGLLIGAILWSINILVQYVRGTSATSKNTQTKPSKGRIIEHEKK